MAAHHENSSPRLQKLHKAPAKKRKFTYLVQKEEARGMQEKVQALRLELEALKGANGAGNYKLHQATMVKQTLKNAVRSQQLTVASTQSMLFNHVRSQPESPMYSRIVLPKKWSKRREVLIGTKNAKFVQCYSYLAERCRSLDMEKNHYSEDRFEDASGNFTCHRFDVIHFRGVQSLKQVYDALTFFMFTMEISISETLGDITVREDYDSLNDGACISTRRLVSTYENGVTTEVITVSCAQLFAAENEFSSSPCALVTADSVDEDELHPYDSFNCIQRDFTAAVVLNQVWRNKRTGKIRPALEQDLQFGSANDEELVVVMRRATFLKVYRPESGTADTKLLELYDRIAKWPDIMLQSIREIIQAPVVQKQ